MSFPCPCCGYLTFEDEPGNLYEICPVCYWEDDPIQNSDPTFSGGANEINLNDARTNFIKFGATQKKYLSNVRKPLPSENPK